MNNMQDLEQVLARKQAVQQGEAARVAKQREQGKLLARERVAKLFDAASFVELDALVAKSGQAEGVVTGYGTVDGRPVYVFSQDYTVSAGAVTTAHAKKIAKVLDLAVKCGAPVVAMCDSAGAYLPEGVAAMNAYAEIFSRVAKMSGVVPMIAMVLGPCVGAAALLPELMDVTLCVDKLGQLMAVGPVTASPEGRIVTAEQLGGAKIVAKNGGVHFAIDNEENAFALTRKLLSMLPDNNLEDAPLEGEEDLNRVLTETDPAKVEALLTNLCDGGDMVQFHKDFAQGACVGLGRIAGQTVGLVANNPNVDGGLLTADVCDKIARFVRFCDCYAIPVLSFVNTKGFAVVTADKQAALLKASARMLYAYAEATTVKLSVITGDAIGAGYVAMGGKPVQDMAYAWPGAYIAPTSPEAAVLIFQKKEIEASTGDAIAARAALAEKYAQEVGDGVNAAMAGFVDDVIDPQDTRKLLIAALEMLSSKRDTGLSKKHGNLPL